MKVKFRTLIVIGMIVCIVALLLSPATLLADTAVKQALTTIIQKEKKVSTKQHASGTFEVKMTTPPVDDKAAPPVVGKFSLDKQFHGELEGTSVGEMLAMSTAVPGSAGYVAMELVKAKLNGRAGTFALQHTGTMNRGQAQLSVTVVPDSGTGELVGLSGKMDIKITDGKHFYEFDYVLAEAP